MGLSCAKWAIYLIWSIFTFDMRVVSKCSGYDARLSTLVRLPGHTPAKQAAHPSEVDKLVTIADSRRPISKLDRRLRM